MLYYITFLLIPFFAHFVAFFVILSEAKDLRRLPSVILSEAKDLWRRAPAPRQRQPAP